MKPYTGIRVVVVAHGPPVKGGITTVAMDLVEDPELNAEFDLVFLSTTQNDDARGRFGLDNLQRVLVDARRTFGLARRGTVVHTHSVQEPWLTAWRQVAIAVAARLRGARVLLHNHAGAPYMQAAGDYRVGRLNAWAFAVLDRLGEANVLIGAGGEANLRRYMPTIELPVVNNSAVVEDFARTSAVHDPPSIVFVGELLERKGVPNLLDALDLLDRRGVEYRLRLIGDNRSGLDPDKDTVIAEIRRRGRDDAMTGPLSRAEVYDHLAQADISVLPTWTEGQPFTIIEALAAGVPIVASDIRAISSMISDPDNGLLVDPHDPVAIADALEELLVDPGRRRRISGANRRLAMERFDRSVFRERLAEMYRRYGRAPGT